MTPANLDSMLPLLPNEITSTEDKEFNTEKLFDQSSPKPTQLRNIKSKLYKGATRIKNILNTSSFSFSTNSFLTLRKTKGLTKDFLSHTPPFIKRHIRARYVVKKFSFLYLNLDRLLKQSPKPNKAIYKAPEGLVRPLWLQRK